MKRIVAICVLGLLVGLGHAPLAQQQDLGVLSRDGLVVCTSSRIVASGLRQGVML